MWRMMLVTLIVCAGCTAREGTLLEDTVWGDMGTRLSSAPRYAPTSTESAPAFYPDLAPAPQAPSPPAARP